MKSTLISYYIGLTLAVDGSENQLFNKKIQENQEIQVRIEEIMKTKTIDPYCSFPTENHFNFFVMNL